MRSEPKTLQEFAEAVCEEIGARLTDRHPEIWPEVQQVEKIQGNSYLGVRIDRGEGAPAPVVNVEPYYEQFTEGAPLRDVLAQLLQDADDALQNIPDIRLDQVTQYNEMKDKIFLQVIPIKGNEERLAGMPYREMEDLAVICRILIGTHDRGEMSFLVTDPILQEYGITKEQLFADAAENMSQNMQYTIRPLFNVLMEMNPVLADEPLPVPDDTLFVCTNEMSMYGAGAIAHPEFIEEAGKKLKGNFFVLPSSIHEVLLLRDNGQTNYHELEAMVKEINATQVAPHDRLSDTVYHVDTLEKVFETAKHFSERQIEKDLGIRGSVLKDLADNRQAATGHSQRANSVRERDGAVL